MTCPTGKLTFHTYAKAIREKDRIRQFQIRSHRERLVDHPYRCPDCGLWHLTSLPKERQAA